jgi:hypothetical protein
VTEDVCLAVVTIFVVVTVVGREDVVVVGILGSRGSRMAEGDGKAARRIATTIRILTRCAVFICMLVHADDTSVFLCKRIFVQVSLGLYYSATHGFLSLGNPQFA